LKGVIEKIRGRKVIAAIVLVSIIAFSVVYALTQMKTGFAVLTTPPPGIPGPYYVTAEAKIYGPVVDLAAIKSKMDGTYASDYTYVQWGTNPFYRVYVDNTLQEVYYGNLIDVMTQFSRGFGIESNLIATYNNAMNLGAIEPSSVLGQKEYFGNLPGTFVALYAKREYQYPSGPPEPPSVGSINVNASGWNAVLTVLNGFGLIDTTLNGMDFSSFSNMQYYSPVLLIDLNSSSGPGPTLEWDLTYQAGLWYMWQYWTPWAIAPGEVWFTIYLENLESFETTIPASDIRVYPVENSPGTGFISKSVSPSSPVIGSIISIHVRFDPPAANNANLTDLYPDAFGWTGSQVVLERYRIGTGLMASTSLGVTPTLVGSNMKISITYDQAPSVLQSILSDEYIQMRYTLNAPSTSAEYTLPAATVSYLIPLPET